MTRNKTAGSFSTLDFLKKKSPQLFLQWAHKFTVSATLSRIHFCSHSFQYLYLFDFLKAILTR